MNGTELNSTVHTCWKQGLCFISYHEKKEGTRREGEDRESNESEEHVSNQILILARGKGRKKGEKKSRRKRNGIGRGWGQTRRG